MMVCVKGGTDAIFEVKDNLASGQPCVVVEVSPTCRRKFLIKIAKKFSTRMCKKVLIKMSLPPFFPGKGKSFLHRTQGSGRAADILAYAHRHATRNSATGVWSLKQVCRLSNMDQGGEQSQI